MLSLPRCAIAVLSIGVAGAAHAQTKAREAGYPQKPVRIIVSSAPGGGQDVTTRPVAQKLGESLGVSVVVDNRGGASGIIAMDVTRQAAPDGYTLLVGATSMILMGVTKKVSYDIRTAFDPGGADDLATLSARVPSVGAGQHAEGLRRVREDEARHRSPTAPRAPAASTTSAWSFSSRRPARS